MSRASGQRRPTRTDDATAGVGIMVSVRDGTFYVSDVVPASPTALSGRIRKDDVILGIAEDKEPAILVAGKPLDEVLKMIRGKAGTALRLSVLPADAKDGRSVEVALTRVNLAPLLDKSDEELRSLTLQQFDQTTGQYWRALSDAGRYKEAADLIERMLGLHPELSLDSEAIIGANLHFHAAQCRAFAGDRDAALRHIVLARHSLPAPGGLLWNEYLDGTAAFLRGDKAALQAARDQLAAGGEANRSNTEVLDRLITQFGRVSYREAYSD